MLTASSRHRAKTIPMNQTESVGEISEKSNKEIKHFGHEHPLIFNESEEIPLCCNACGLYILSSPHYFCAIQDCSFYLHQACTQLPHELHHDFANIYWVDRHALTLFANPKDDNCLCGECGKLCENFTYHCSDSECEFVLHPLCGFPLDIQIQHISHRQHPLVATCKEVLLRCDVCGNEHKGYFYSCHQCNFWIHQDCALLPSFTIVDKHNHALSLLYSSSALLGYYIAGHSCLLCGEMTTKRFGFYFCFVCHLKAHLDCATSEMKNLGIVLQLPTTSRDTFLSLIMRTVLKERTIGESDSKNMPEKYHAHPLVLIDDTTQESLCNACIQPVSPPYYRCTAQSECNFLLHKFCADLPLVISDSFYQSEFMASLASPKWDEFFSLFRCKFCHMHCNGFGYSYSERISIVADLECALAPKVIKHESHRQHPLILIGYCPFEASLSCCGNEYRFSLYVYNCSVCDFNIDIHCAFLPKTVTHKFDPHPLTLAFPSSSKQHSDSTECFCEFCEEDIDPMYWFYHCAECDQSFHVDCIPSLGKFSKIKFGGTVKLPCHNDHPLTLVRMLSIGNQICEICYCIIEGFKDGMALHCADCDFWIHFLCGDRFSDVQVSHPYLNFSFLLS